VAGRAQVISLRGLAPDFAVTLLNGREQTSTSNDRSAEFDQYPSELLNGVTVYKTPDAALTSAGLSGTIDLRTVRPLDRRGRTIAVQRARRA
jgi:iron complex outermembrane receptor protein